MLFLPQAAGVRDPAHALQTSLKSGAAKALDLPEKARTGAAAAALDACELPCIAMVDFTAKGVLSPGGP